MYYYTGVGARRIPIKVQTVIREIGNILAVEGYILRSGGAKGSDKSFEVGCNRYKGKKEIYLPWEGFEKSTSTLIVSDKRAFDIAEKYHPTWNKLNKDTKKLHARNSHQVLGLDLNSPSKFLICYTHKGLGGGGTGQALRVARDYNIPILDLGLYDTDSEMYYAFNKFMEFNNYTNIQKQRG